MKIFSPANRQSLIMSLIGSAIFLYFLQPIFNILGGFILGIYRSLSETLYDRLFQEVARGKPDYDFIVILMIMMTLAIPFMLTAVFPWGKKETAEEDSSINIVRRSGLVFPSWPIRVASFSVFAIVVTNLALSDLKLKTIQTFDQQIRVLSPYISSKQKDILISDFSRMETSRDFEKINRRIQALADSCKLKLPTPLRHLF